MIRAVFATCLLAFASVLAYAQYPGPPGKTPPAAAPQQTVISADEVPPDAVVISVRGICPPGKGGTPENSDSCTVTITRQQFETMLAVMNVTNQNYSPPALRGIAESYVQLMTLADAGQREGLDRDARFEEMMRIARVRTMAEMYRHSLDAKFSAPPPEAIEAYYKDNIGKYEQLKVDRVFIPLADPKRPQERVAFEKKARLKIGEIRERAANGEDMNALQAEAYKALGLSSPPATDLGGKRKGNFPPAVEKDIFALKPAEVTKVETDLSGYSFYKVRSREPIPLEFVKAEITREMYQKNMEAAIKSTTSRVHAELNEKFFKPHVAGNVPPAFRPAPHVSVETGPATTPGATGGSAGASPATNPGNPPSPAATPPK
jgi:hypothetical protein